MLILIQKAFGFVGGVIFSPEHIVLHTMNSSIEESLRKLEHKAELPKGDLYLTGVSEEKKDGTVLISTKHFVASKTSDTWAEITKSNSISGYILESHNSNSLDRSRLSVLACRAIDVRDSLRFYGLLYITKNCSGSYVDDVCTKCGYRRE